MNSITYNRATYRLFNDGALPALADTLLIRLGDAGILLPNSGSCGQCELEVAEVAGSGAIEGMAGPPGVQADEVERDRGEHML